MSYLLKGEKMSEINMRLYRILFILFNTFLTLVRFAAESISVKGIKRYQSDCALSLKLNKIKEYCFRPCSLIRKTSFLV